MTFSQKQKMTKATARASGREKPGETLRRPASHQLAS